MDEKMFAERFECNECGVTFIALKGSERDYCEVHKE